VYAWIALGSAGSWLATIVTVRVFRLTATATLALLAATAVGLYYWWAAPAAALALGAPAMGTLVGRGGALALVLYWLIHAWPRLSTNNPPHS
jgi:hypothetical protein